MPRILRWGIIIAVFLWAIFKMGGSSLVTLAQVADLPQIPNTDHLAAFKGEDNQSLTIVNGLLVADYLDHQISFIPSDRLPLYLRQAFIAIEDSRFYQHGPVDFRGILRAVVNNVKDQEMNEGGSTITQQLAKNLFLSQRKSLYRKLEEVYLAYQLESKYNKSEILEMYLNQIYFGGGAYGVDQASRKLFGISATQVSLGQAAMLAGLTKNPGAYWPIQHPEAGKKRQAIVLDRMAQLGYISQDEAQTAKEEDVLAQIIQDNGR